MYGILRANKIKLGSLTNRLQKHIQREANFYNTNPDINIQKAKNEDIILIYSKDYKKSVYEELKKHNITKQPRKNAVGLIDIVLTASPEFFENKSKEDINTFFKDSLKHIESKYGPIISAAIHYSEKSPHLHAVSVPIVKGSDDNYKLSARDIMGNRAEFIRKQDYFYEEFFSKYGLDRGKSVKETNRKHIDTMRLKADTAHENYINSIKATNKQKETTQDLIIEEAELQSKIVESKKTYDEIIDESKKSLDTLEEIIDEIDKSTIRKNIIKDKIKSLEELYESLKNYLIELASNSELFSRLLENAILSGDYDNIEELSNTKQESDEAQQILDYMGESYINYQRELELDDDLEL